MPSMLQLVDLTVGQVAAAVGGQGGDDEDADDEYLGEDDVRAQVGLHKGSHA